MSVIPEDYITSIVGKVATICNLSEWSYSKQSFENLPQNYFGVLIPVALSGRINGEGVSIPLVLKLAPTDERYRVSGAVSLMFAREIFVYSTILEKYKEHQQNTSNPYVIPKCYFVVKEHCQEVIVMQDMRAAGYHPHTHEMFLDVNHITVSLKSLAKLHGLSFILREREPKLYEDAVTLCVPLSENNNKRFMDILRDRLMKALQKLENTDYQPLLETLKHNCARLVEAAVDSVEDTCICHGDIWKENILFKYEDNTPISACIIDYQTTRMCSPAFDVLYLITSSTDSGLRQKYFYKLLDIYYETFEQTLKEAGFNTHEIYSRHVFSNDLKVVGSACFIVVNTALWLSNGLQEEGHIRSKQVWTTAEEKAKAVENYKTIIKGIIDDFSNYGYL